jgi:hypothetical protein
LNIGIDFTEYLPEVQLVIFVVLCKNNSPDHFRWLKKQATDPSTFANLALPTACFLFIVVRETKECTTIVPHILNRKVCAGKLNCRNNCSGLTARRILKQ